MAIHLILQPQVGSHNITYAYTDANGCSASATASITVNPLPVVSAGTYPAVCVSSAPVTLTGAPAGGTFSGPGVTGTTFNPATAGVETHTITYSYTNANGCTNTATTSITVNALPVVNAGTYAAVCISGSPVTLSGTPAGGAFSGPGVSGTTFNPATAGAGTHTITYSYTNANGCTNSATTTITVNPLPVLNPGNYPSVCVSGPPVTLSGTPGGGTFSGPGVSSNSFNPATAGAGTHTITYTYTDANGCTNTATTTITVNALPVVSAGTYPAVCVSAPPVTLSGTPVGGTFSGPGVSGTTFNPATAGTGTHTITYNYTDANGCAGSATTTITVNALPTVNAGTYPAMCVSAAPITLSGTPAGGTFSGPGVSGTAFNPATAGVGTHTITYSYTNGNGCTNTATTTITVNALPVVSAGSYASVCVSGTPITLAGTPVGGTFSGPGVTGTTFNPGTAGVGAHTITYSYTDANGCAATATTTITVNTLPTVNAGTYPAMCVNAASITLSGTPAGGTFSGPGVSGTTFNPATAGVGTRIITYTYANANGCTNTATTTIIVNALPVVNAGTYPSVCMSGAPVTLAGMPAGGTFSGPGVTGNTFSPATAGAGTHTITYSYTDANGCTAAATTSVTVNALPVVNAGTYPAVCVNGASIMLAGSPAGGTFSGPGVTGSTFNAATAGAGPHTITYTYTNANGCTNTATTSITVNPLPTVSAGTYAAVCISASPITLAGTPIGGTFSGPGVTGTTFNPATAGVGTHTITYSYTNADGCSNTATATITVNPLPALNPGTYPSVCVSGPPVTLSGTPGGGTFSGPGVTGTSFNPATAGAGTHTITYNYTDANGCANTATTTITVNPQITPTFTAIAALCQNSTAPALPATSNNGIPGIWSPATISTATAGTTTYTFTPAAGQCATTATLTVVIDPQITPAFTAIGPLCQNSTAPALPATSNNGITGTWTPATINTATAGTTTYTFTPSAGHCAITGTLSIVVNPQITPAFSAIGPLCQNGTAPALPATSNNGINGTWSPATINTATPGTTTYTFTPSAGQCAIPATLSITINPQITPIFTAIGPLCQNGIAPALPATSNNGINGTWSPATINTATPGTSTYTFTPATGQCATTGTLSITINPQITPTFTAIGPLCQTSTPPALPTTSTNGITGTWSPATISTATAGTTMYTFTPSAGQCATPATLSITITAQLTPAFSAIGPLCQNSAAPTLPAISNNGVNGTWSPATINTSTGGTTIYTFTPAAGQCATTATLSITIDPQITPTFTAIGPLCQNSTAPVLPTTSNNGITGTWSSATISTTTAGTTTYTFTPTAGQCATPATLSVTINPQITPTFTAIGPLCQNSTAPVLPTTSNNGITGTWSPATISTSTAGTTTYTFTPATGQCATTATLSVTINPQITPSFTAIGPLCQNSSAPTLPATSNNGIPGTWNPATISTSTAGTTTYTFTPASGQCATPATLSITITPQITPTFTAIGPLCQNSTAPTLPATSTNGINGTWSPATISTATPGTITYTFTPASAQCATTATLSVTIEPQIAPTFTAIGPLCQNSTVPVLPTTSSNGITGTWSPATINTTTPGTTSYTFTPASGQCATTATLSVTINAQVTPAFTAIGPLCQNAAAPTLPTTSTNGIAGTWNPATISTGTAGTTTYTFTPAAGQCATTSTLSVTINPQVTPTFTAIGPLCQNSTAPVLAATSNNGVTGTWSPATISTATAGTTTYTFTPAAGQCAINTTLIITVSPQITPTFAAIGPLCQNSTAPALPTTSNNSIPGTWSPATISTATAGSTTYTFTPSAGQCATTATLSITVSPQVTPTFSAIGPLCQNSSAPALPTTSNNGIAGTWSPATISTTTAGTTTYTFTPVAGQCATTASLSITIDPQVTPTFTAIGPLCQNITAPVLPTTSNNGITGTWSPATISTTTAGTTSYTFTPSAGQCATTASLSITVSPQVTPTFTQIGPLCQNSTAPVLPTTSNNGITGTWNPATISTSASGTTTYTFTPAAGQCATVTTMEIVISTQIAPTFTQIGPLCHNSTAPALPTTSTNGITGTWSPATISTSAIGTITYTFTPNAGQCGITTTMDVVITSQITPTFTQIGPLCQNSTAPALPTTSNNNITGTWSPAVISTSTVGSTTYTFTPNGGQCGTSTTMTVVITAPVTPTFTAIGSLCQNSGAPGLPPTSNNGITGTWSPATISTATVGTTVYTFTPGNGQCATTTTLSITVDAQTIPTFTAIGPLCQNSTAPALPATSNNGVTGTWSPATINTSVAGTSFYAFTPSAGQCAAIATLSVTISTQVVPAFTQIGPLCQNSTAPALPTTSANGIAGTWSPATINTSATGTTTYSFTPNAGQCGVGTTMDVVVTSQITPTFTQIGPLCRNSTAPALPTTSNNGITGTWSPATINTSATGTTTYTFTPTAGQCGAITTMDIAISNAVVPTFSPIGPLCQNSGAPALPGTSANGISGTWNPATISTGTAGTTTYTFTPNAGQCATTATLSITVDPQVTPTFVAIGPLCQNTTAPALPATSANGISGTWNPAIISTTTAGTSVYIFTPAAGQCATTASLSITVSPQITPTFTQIGPLCQNGTAPVLPTTSNNGITGTWSPATISTSTLGSTTYTFTPAAGQCGAITTMNIVVTTQLVPAFDAIGPLCQNSGAPALPATSNNGITGTWNPATISTATPGATVYTFTPNAGQCATTTTLSITVDAQLTPAFTQIAPLCQNSTAPVLPTTSNNGVSGTWSPATINTTTAGTTTYTFTPAVGHCAISITMAVTVSPQLAPTFTQIGPLCQNSTAPVLPTTSNNGVTGTWNPATINTGTIGTTTYTFTPAGGQCAIVVTMDVVITTQITPAFTAIGPLCQNSGAPALPATSNNGITGTWNPATISTATAGTTVYTFTPNAGQCATTATLSVTVDPLLIPSFTAIGPLCQNSTPPALPATSNNGVSGTWSPATINTSTPGTTSYTFTPNAGQCATTSTLNITVNAQITPTFTQIGPLCQSSTAPALPTTSNNGITGTWNPAVINTSVTGTTTYTFTPGAGMCATTVTMDVVIGLQITPTFTQIGPLCQNSTAPALPTTSNNGITGTWSPAVINTSAIGTTTYTFTPGAGQCGSVTTMDVVITLQITPSFTQIGPLCQNSTAPALPVTSNNGITGTWSPAVINTSAIGTTTYTFTPGAGQCGGPTTMDIAITTPVIPGFTQIGPLCHNSGAPALPVVSNNGITGSWSPATINTGVPGTTVYTFTPNAGQCATSITMSITINAQVIPTFTQIGPPCQNSTAPALPATSNNGITGTWSPATINTSVAGTTVYTFMPAAGQCATTATLSITVDTQLTPVFTQIGPLCQNSTAPALPATSNNGVTGTWNPAVINTSTVGTTTYTFTPSSGACAITATIDVVISSQITPTFTQMGPLCQNATAPALPTTSNNGITGTWNPAVVNTSVIGTTTYTFTPNGGQCGAVTTMDIVISTQVTPTFTQIGPLCQNAAAPALPATSNNGITGVWSPATVNTSVAGPTTYTFTPNAGQCGSITTMDVVITPQVTPTFNAVGPLCQNAAASALPATSNNAVTGTWSPATINTSVVGTTVYTFTPAAGQCATTVTLSITVNTQVTPAFTQIGPLCQNSTAPALPTTSNNGVTGTWSPAIINTSAIGTTTYTFTPGAGQCGIATTMDIVISSQIIPTFTQIGPLCQNAPAPVFPSTSNNGITGIWNPATINTSVLGTTTYTFTPNAGQCGAVTTMDVVIGTQVIPTFTQIGPLCQNATAPLLPATSNNGITGTWNPATINTSVAGTTTYTFTPNAGQCGSITTMDVVITPQVTPTFNAIGPLCQNATAPLLPATSNNGVTGTWNPATINTTAVGTTVYTFTPATGQCATIATLSITINTQAAPTFTQIGPLCQNSTAPALPPTSNNGITGMWNPAIINTSAIGTATYTFTPDAGQCAVTATMDVTIASQIIPTFTQIGPLCQNATAPALPTTSNNGIIGTWSPAVINTSVLGTTTYTFTPNAGQCGAVTTMDILISTQVTPTFTQIGPLCQNATAPALPATSNNGITGVWSPATINTSTVGTTTYTFTPNAGQCGSATTMDIMITQELTPTFNTIGPLCQNSTAPLLPLTSNNGVTGTWNPAVINTATVGTSVYTFTPAAGQCATIATLNVTINAQITPVFTQIGPLCQNATAPALPTTSNNGITGTWNPAVVNTSVLGTTTYTFTPNAGQCGAVTTMDIVISTQVMPTFTQIGPLCQNATAPALPTTSNNGITGTWNPAVVNTSVLGSTTYTFTPNAGQCGAVTTMDILISTQVTPTFTQIGSLCQNATAPALPTTSNNGIIGTWSPAVINTSVLGTTTYTFTPNAGQCGAVTTMDILISTQITPTFTQIGPLCQNATAPALPTTSNNGITGTWNPAVVNTSTLGLTTYTFTPNAGQCGAVTTMDIVISTQVIPTFTQIGPLCQNATAPTLPTTSNNGITGTWNPAVVNTSTLGLTTYTFTPNAGQCGAVTTMDIVISTQVMPTFTQIGPLCQNATAPTLPTTSNNGIIGTWSPAVINTSVLGTTTYTFTPNAGQCGAVTTMDILISTQVTPTFTQIRPLCQNATAPALPATSNNGITGVWSPATINTSTVGTTTYTFTPNAGQCGSATTMDIVITQELTPTFNTIGPLCQNSTAPALPLTSNNGITGTWNPAVINTAVVGTAVYTFAPAGGQCATSATLSVIINAQITPAFTQIGPLCQNSTAPTLPATSNNGITGTWNPAVINTSVIGTTRYTFTPDAGQCAVTAIMDITIASQILATFTQIGPLCHNSTAPALPTTSNNGITGTWNPAVINTSTIGTTTYTFTPNAGQCGAVTTMDVVISTQVIPTFTQIGPLCQNAIAPALPTTSNNGITGTWNPAVINTSTIGTTTYTFTPNAGQCGAVTTMDVVISTQVTPTFTQIGPLCQNATAPALPATSNNGITGVWNPATINTSTPGATTYTFTPNANQCGSVVTMDITITAQVTPIFTQISPLCQNATAPSLATTSNNGVTGTWSPATINTSATGTTTYTFTPNANQCAVTVTMDINITSQIIPTFSQIGPLCQNATAPALPTISNNGITGTWNPATINTTNIGTTTYIFTPNAGQCGSVATMDITITSQLIPTFTQIGPLCQNATAPTLPTTSNNGITGTWNPATISTSTLGTTTYTFTPNTGQCGSSTTMNITITTLLTPTFTAVGPLCQNTTAPPLPTTSTDGITGTWNPATINTSTLGTTTYTFTPNTGQCATPTTLNITINPQLIPTFTSIAPLCQNAIAPALPTTSNNGITGTWNPSTINTNNAGTTNYTFTPTTGPCAAITTLTITVNPVTTSTTNVTVCPNQLPYSWNGQSYSAAGTYNINFQNSTGCDSIATLVLAVSPLLTSTTNVTICNNQLPYSWNGNSYNSAGTYSVTLHNAAGCDSLATLVLVVTPVQTSTTNEFICSNQLPYAWNGQSYNQAGTYTVRLTTQSGCDSIATLVLTIVPLATATVAGDGNICFGGTATLTLNLTGAGPWTVVYSDGTTSHTIGNITGTTYTLNVSPTVTTTYSIISVANVKCTNTNINSAATVTVTPAPPGIRYTDELALANISKQLQARSLGAGYTYTWTPAAGLDRSAISNPTFTYNKTTQYTIALRSSKGCLTVDTLLVKVLAEASGDLPPELFVPKAWTPNGDGKNDYLFPFPVHIRELRYFRVFNRWGQLMFETKDLLKGWDGIWRGRPQVMDAYTWTAEAIGIDGSIIKRSGNAALLR